MLTFGKFTTELPGWVDGRVNLASNFALRFRNCRNHIRKRDVIANHHEVNIAAGGFRSRCHRAKDEGYADAVCDVLQRLSKRLGYPEGLSNDAPKLWKYWTLAIRLEVDLPPLHSSNEDPGHRKALQISLHSARSKPYCLDDSALIESFVRAPEK